MNAIVGARIAKSVALLGFFLPWALFSCSGQEFATMSGVDMAVGHIHANGQDQNTGFNIFIIVAIVATGIGLLVSFSGDLRDEARGVFIASIVAIIASFAGMMWLKGTPEREAHNQASSGRSNYSAQMNASVLAMIQIKEQYGYFVTMLGLAGAAVLSGMALTGRQLPPLPEGVADALLTMRRRPEDDVAGWDRLTDKDNPDQLQEYLLRHPTGRFAELARMKLERMGIEPLRPTAHPPTTPHQADGHSDNAPAPEAAPALLPHFEPVASDYGHGGVTMGAPAPRAIPVAGIILIVAIALAGLGAGGYYLKQYLDAQSAAAAAQQAAATAQAERDALTRRLQACQSHEERSILAPVLQDCADLVWNADSTVSQAAGAQISRTSNYRAQQAREQTRTLASVPEMFVDEDACPGEGCQYGVWQARQPTTLYDAPDGNATGAIAANERVIAWRGEVHLHPIHGVVRQAFDQFSQGDEVYLLTSVGEGYFRIWHAGEIVGTSYPIESCDAKQAQCQSAFDFGEFQQDSHWWVMVRRQDGSSGWVSDTQNFSGTDAFE